ncbi:2TM domain-containing protein [[Eubacterium] cellulosolvens]
MSSDEELRSKARKRAEEKIGFYTHAAVYVIVNLFLIVVWWFTGGLGTFPWFIFPLFGWGIAIVIHFIGTFKGLHYSEKMIEKEYEKLKKQEN